MSSGGGQNGHGTRRIIKDISAIANNSDFIAYKDVVFSSYRVPPSRHFGFVYRSNGGSEEHLIVPNVNGHSQRFDPERDGLDLLEAALAANGFYFAKSSDPTIRKRGWLDILNLNPPIVDEFIIKGILLKPRPSEAGPVAAPDSGSNGNS